MAGGMNANCLSRASTYSVFIGYLLFYKLYQEKRIKHV